MGDRPLGASSETSATRRELTKDAHLIVKQTYCDSGGGGVGGGVRGGRVVRTRATDVWSWCRSLTGSLLVERRGVGRSHSVWWWPAVASEVCLKERPCGPVVGQSVWWWRVWGLTQMSRSRRHVARVGGVRERIRITDLAELLGGGGKKLPPRYVC